MKYIHSINWLLEHLDDPNTCIVDCRFNLADPDAGERAYKQAHIPGAFYAHLDRDLSGGKGVHGGRHPLPDLQVFQKTVEAYGITDETVVIAYDNGDAMFAGRFWWLLSYIGHQHVYILDGGFSEWEKRKLPVSVEIPVPKQGRISLNVQQDWIASIEDVKKAALEKGGAILIDSRAPERYAGKVEPLDRVPGHIPTAVNYFFQEGLNGSLWKTAEEQKERFHELNPADPIIVYCGSGVSATPNIIALKQAGFQHVRLYAGSYSDWSSYEELPVEKKDH
ncbi:3-mercaptopyruvate sulfurtransferase [Bacillus sp. FJAT-27231]|uniref:sulfurtransferase n=1 Tax=Bacillus sp. FJAT-27231 TaxID=1679168 RepID=UPI0006A0B0FA|nr:sulfurtransferase [Bacillus sp. FJAT-27231]KMY54567.1 3-mercaptopyruvate sulfurtransferase [Bacillus sp. FJAT-27231]